jgi:hypothetical protein
VFLRRFIDRIGGFIESGVLSAAPHATLQILIARRFQGADMTSSIDPKRPGLLRWLLLMSTSGIACSLRTAISF